jgi:hypothetical protein
MFRLATARPAIDPTRSAGLAREHFLLGKNEVWVLNRSPEARLEFTNISRFSGSSKANLQNEAKEKKICLIMSGKTWKRI